MMLYPKFASQLATCILLCPLIFLNSETVNAQAVTEIISTYNTDFKSSTIDSNTKTELVLPVGITSFISSVSGSDIHLSWQTDTESNSSYFEIESSIDGNQFNKLGTVNTVANSSSNIEYSFEDRDVVSGAHYYRLKQFDKDGKFEYSKIIKQVAFIEKNELSVSAYPNPAVNNVIVTNPASVQEGVLNLYNSVGKLLWTKKIAPGTTQTNVNISSYSQGSYIFQFSNSQQETSVVRFLIK
jgi:hypothetical protein